MKNSSINNGEKIISINNRDIYDNNFKIISFGEMASDSRDTKIFENFATLQKVFIGNDFVARK